MCLFARGGNGLEFQDNKTAAPPQGAAGLFDSGGQNRPPSSTDTLMDSAAAYIDMNSLAGDIQKIVTSHIENSIPDDKKIMMELVNQMGKLTGEVQQLRQQLSTTNPYAVFSCPNTPSKDISEELAEIKALLQTDPKPQVLTDVDIDPVMLGPSRRNAGTESSAPEHAAHAAHEEPQRDPDFDTDLAPRAKKSGKRKAVSVIGNLLFYAVVIGVVLGVFLAKSGSGGSPTVIAGYSAFTVLSSSMEDTYPKGSLIVTRSVDANELEIGDDITYMASVSSSITHRIIGITENYLDTGARAFETQGTMNKDPDKDPVAAANVVGKVIFCSVLLGRAASFVSTNWPLLIFFAVVLAILFAFLKWNFRREDDPAHGKKRANARSR